MRTRPSRSLRAGFTIVELAVVIIVLTTLATIAVVSTTGYQEMARDNQRASDTSVIANRLEQYYRTNAVATGATYPDASTNSATFLTIVGDHDAVTAPDQEDVSLKSATSSGTPNPTVSEYIYQPLNLDGSLCTSVPCVRFKLYYRTEDVDTLKIIDSMRQQ